MRRIHWTRLRAAASAALLSVSLAAPALADRDGWRDDHRRRGYPVHRHERSCDHDGRGSYYGDRSYVQRWYRHYDDRYYGERRYGCRPCGRHWRSEDRFHRHLHGHHGVPYRVIPRVLVYADWGWWFRG